MVFSRGVSLVRTVARFAVVTAAAVVASACASSPETKSRKKSDVEKTSRADKHYDVAVGSFHNGMFSDARIQIDRALSEDPEHADSHYLQGVLLLNEGKSIVDAIEIQQCLQDDAAAQQRVRAESLHREAGDAFERAATAYPEGASGRGRALNSMSVVSLFFHDTDDATSSAELALAEQFYTARYSALSNLGWAQYLEGDTVSATASLRQAVLINPSFCVGHYRLAQIYLDSGLNEHAYEHAKQVTENDQCPIQDAWRIAGVAQMRLGQEPGAAEALQKCVDLAPRSCQAEDCRHLLGPANTEESEMALQSTR
ncbi:MAG: tetratricopeptide repeat protein [Nannocystales bacterium]